jgi:phosphoserine phosphatase
MTAQNGKLSLEELLTRESYMDYLDMQKTIKRWRSQMKDHRWTEMHEVREVLTSLVDIVERLEKKVDYKKTENKQKFQELV